MSRRRALALGGAALSSWALGVAGLAVGRQLRAPDGAAAAPATPPQAGDATPPGTPAVAPTIPSQEDEYWHGARARDLAATPAPTPTPRPGFEPRPAWSTDVLRQVVRSGPSDRPLVALTIDDGWSARDAVLDALRARNVHPTLFLAGRAIAGDSAFIARALDAGCEIANHTMDHYTLTDKSKAYIQKDLEDFENLVQSLVPGATTKPYMRPSGGSLNQAVIEASAEAGYRPILWSVSTGDGSASTTPDQMVRNALTGARPGAIILMHFGPRAVAALPGLVDGLRAMGLEPVSLTKLFEAGG